ncbi:mitofusin [Ceratobasidium sp. 414]|nr:mitofusin [Ceratobasidium sp. 414]
MSFIGDPVNAADVVYGVPKPGMRRTITPLPELPEGLVPNDFHVLRPDFSLDPNSVHHPSALVSNLDKASVARLLDGRIEVALTHVGTLEVRIAGTLSKVLVIGNLNTGKPTCTNPLLHHDTRPVDQQPLTSVFCEVHDALENDNIEEVHVIPLDKVASYDRTNPATFTRTRLDAIEMLQGDLDAEAPPDYALKLYASDPRSLNNGTADTTLIDAPGLNRDSVKTTNLFVL